MFFVAKLHALTSYMLYMNLLYIHAGKQRVVVFLTLQKKQSRCVPGWTAEHSLARDRSFFSIDYRNLRYIMLHGAKL